MGWLWLGFAILLEVSGTISMKFSNSFDNIIPSILMFLFYGISFTCLNFALEYMNVSTAYAIWSGIGIILITFVGYSVFKDQLNLSTIIWIGVIIVGVVGLNISTPGHQ
ncbi:DMT family transporter [Paenibacillus endoradicis]|uniref:DMT family transporter n=1 Tax=Paenibacillus endoradicis TaxID=2972487 RepID=UPI0021597F5F|nr:multidrug efflux SMR transporter [Paenibacillus endoradicis]